jgi:hypothetical protein
VIVRLQSYNYVVGNSVESGSSGEDCQNP